LQGKSFHIITLGCKVNQYESEALREAWLRDGHHELKSPAEADLVLINSCAITAKAISDLRAVSRRVRRLTPQGEILVTGCAAEALPEELNTLPVDALVPQRKKFSLLRYLGPAEGFENMEISDSSSVFPEHSRHKTCCPENINEPTNGLSDEFWDYSGPEEIIDTATFPPFSISDYARTRAVLKIQDGCSQHCTYCIVPKGRGPSVSRPWQAILAEAGRLVCAGFREIVLNGVNLRQYGMDLPDKQDFWSLLTRISAAFAPEWGRAPDAKGDRRLRFRISSLEPGQLDQNALDTLAQNSLITPHLHLSLQSGSGAILKKMGRGHYNVHKIPDFLESLQQIWPKFGLGADFIVGFPGESEEDFAETMDISRMLPLSYAHVFPYSLRSGTAAAGLPGQISQEIKKERAARLRALISRKKQDFLQSQLKLERVFVVPEEGKKGRGVNEFYSDCRFMGKNIPHGKNIVPAKPVAVEKDTLLIQ
jgi:MiaB/RimO family radical SAM methylthiotransferase